MFLGVVERDTGLAFCALFKNTTKLALNESTQQLQLVLEIGCCGWLANRNMPREMYFCGKKMN